MFDKDLFFLLPSCIARTVCKPQHPSTIWARFNWLNVFQFCEEFLRPIFTPASIFSVMRSACLCAGFCRVLQYTIYTDRGGEPGATFLLHTDLTPNWGWNQNRAQGSSDGILQGKNTLTLLNYFQLGKLYCLYEVLYF